MICGPLPFPLLQELHSRFLSHYPAGIKLTKICSFFLEIDFHFVLFVPVSLTSYVEGSTLLWNDKMPTYALKESLSWMFKIQYFIDTDECLSIDHDGGKMAALKLFIVKVHEVFVKKIPSTASYAFFVSSLTLSNTGH